MWATRLLLMLAFTGFLSWLPAGLASEEVVDETTVRRLIVRLDADRRADRQRAEEELLRLGPKILAWLPEPNTLSSRSAAEAVRRVRSKLERQKAEAAVEASRLSLEGSHTVAELLAALPRDTGNSVTADALPPNFRAGLVELPHRPTFWDVIHAVSQQQSVTWHCDGSPARLRFVPLKSPATADDRREELAVAQSRAFRVALRSLQRRSVVGADDEQSAKLMRFEFEVTSEPRLRPLFVKCSASDLKVTGLRTPLKDKRDEADAARSATQWEPYSPDATLELTFGQGRRQVSFPMDFRVPDGDWQKLSVSGRTTVQTAAAEEAIEFPAGAAARGVARRRGGVTVKVDRWEVEELGGRESLTVSATVLYDTGGPAFESHRSWMLSNVAGLMRAVSPNSAATTPPTSPDEALLLPTHGENNLQPNGAIEVVYRFDKLPQPAEEFRFRYVAPSLILDVPLEFELQQENQRSLRRSTPPR